MPPSSQEQSFLAAMSEEPDEDAHRLVYAGWRKGTPGEARPTGPRRGG
jgi:uncharacterized protein (TIGR02996 family)